MTANTCITLVGMHDTTKGPEAHQVYIFDLTSANPGNNHHPSVFEYRSEKYRAFATHEKVTPKKEGNKIWPVHRVKAVKCSDEAEWMKVRHGAISSGVLDGYQAR